MTDRPRLRDLINRNRPTLNKLDSHLGCVTCSGELKNGICSRCDPSLLPDADIRLFGPPGAENLEFDADSALDHVTPEGEVEIEEWTVYPPQHHLPTVEHLLEWIAESDYDVVEGWWESAEDAITHPEVIAAAEALLDTMASKITFRMAANRVATHRYRWEGSEEDGEWVLEKGDRQNQDDDDQ